MICKIKKGVLYLVLVMITGFAISVEYPLLMLEFAFWGAPGSQGMTMMQSLLHWFVTCTVWGFSFCGISYLLKKSGFNIFEKRCRLTWVRFFLILFIVLVGILYMSSTWEFQFKPMAEWNNMMSRYEGSGVWAFLFQYLYYLFECMLISLIIIAGHEAGECFFSFKRADNIPWGGIVCALTWGMLHALSMDWSTAILCIFLSLLFGIAYLLANKNFRYAYPAIALIFLL